MLTQKQIEIIEQIKQEFESHNESINSSSSLLNLQGIISDIQDRDNFIKELMAINTANYNSVWHRVHEELEVLNRELEVLGFRGALISGVDPRGQVCCWSVLLSNIDSSLQQEFMSIDIRISRHERVEFRGKAIDKLSAISSDYKWVYGGCASLSFVGLFKNDHVRNHLSYYWERFNK